MRTTLVIGSALASAAFATPALAQNDDHPFTGPRAEAIAGWDHVVDDSDYGASRDGVTYGGALGYDVQLGKVVLGVEGRRPAPPPATTIPTCSSRAIRCA